MKKLNILILLLTVLTFACEKQVFNKTPQDFFTEDDVWNDFGLIQQFGNKLYLGLESWNVFGHADNMLAAYTDDAFSAENLGGVYDVNSGSIAPDLMGALDVWRFKYKYIRNANIFLSKMDGITLNVNESEVAVLKGEARFIRANLYFDLIKNYGGVPLITDIFNLDDDFQLPRNGFEEIVDWIVEELDEAEKLVPLNRPDNEWGRIDKGICLALKAKVLLYANSKLHRPGGDGPQGDFFTYSKNTWQECADAAKAVIDMPKYQLQEVNNWQEYQNLFINPNPEIIFPKMFSVEFPTQSAINTTNGFPKSGGYMETQALQGLVDEFEMSNGKAIHESGSGYDNSPEKIYENRDMRFYADINFLGSVQRGVMFDPVHPSGFDVNVKFTTTGYPVRKFQDDALAINEEQPVYPRIRLADVYLMYAEAQIGLGNEDEAREYINKIRNRVHLPDINSSGNELVKALQHERRIEMCFENSRFFDVRRWMIATETDNKPAMGISWEKLDVNGGNNPGNLKYSFIKMNNRVFDKKFYYLPIPKSEMDRTDLLEQNPGY